MKNKNNFKNIEMEKEIQNLEKNEIQVSQDDKENNKDLIKDSKDKKEIDKGKNDIFIFYF